MSSDPCTRKCSPGFQNMKGSAIKSMLKYATPSTISLSGGIPLDSTFPFTAIKVDLDNGESFTAKNRALTGGSREQDGAADLPLNYITGLGLPRLRALLTEQMKEDHNPPYEGWAVIPTVGSTDAIMKCLQMFKQDGRTNVVLAEKLVWAAVLAMAEPLGYEVVGVEMDGEGMIPSSLESICAELDKQGKRPSMLYTTPHGQNPTGCSLSMERKKQVYALAQKFDLVIVEDDPYRNISLPEDLDEDSLDTDGRVLHLDSLSKYICPGLRVGWITGPKAFVEGPFRLYTEVSVQFPSTVSQVMLQELLIKWGNAGIDRHLKKIQAHYARQRKVMVKAAEKHLTGLAEWTVPKAGMFIWFHLTHLRGKGVEDTMALFQEVIKEDVLPLPGHAFDATGGKAPPAFRVTYATAAPKDIEEAISRLGKVLARHAHATNGTTNGNKH